MTDFDLLAAVGLVSVNVAALWGISYRFESKVETIVSRHTQAIVAHLVGRADAAEHKAENANLNALTVNRNHNELAKRVDGLEERVSKLEGMP